MFNSIDICSFYPVSGYLGMGPSALPCPGPIILLRRPAYNDVLFRSTARRHIQFNASEKCYFFLDNYESHVGYFFKKSTLDRFLC